MAHEPLYLLYLVVIFSGKFVLLFLFVASLALVNSRGKLFTYLRLFLLCRPLYDNCSIRHLIGIDWILLARDLGHQ